MLITVIESVFNFSQHLNHPFLKLYLDIASVNHPVLYSNILSTLSYYSRFFTDPDLNIIVIPNVFIEQLGYLLTFTSRNLPQYVSLVDFSPVYNYVLTYHSQWLVRNSSSLQYASSQANDQQSSSLLALNAQSVLVNNQAQQSSSVDIARQVADSHSHVDANVFERISNYIANLSENFLIGVAVLGGGVLLVVVCIKVSPYVWRYMTEINLRTLLSISSNSSNTQVSRSNDSEE